MEERTIGSLTQELHDKLAEFITVQNRIDNALYAYGEECEKTGKHFQSGMIMAIYEGQSNEISENLMLQVLRLNTLVRAEDEESISVIITDEMEEDCQQLAREEKKAFERTIQMSVSQVKERKNMILGAFSSTSHPVQEAIRIIKELEG